jgi:hypothetical protein
MVAIVSFYKLEVGEVILIGQRDESNKIRGKVLREASHQEYLDSIVEFGLIPSKWDKINNMFYYWVSED